jgi:hypothetical protein
MPRYSLRTLATLITIVALLATIAWLWREKSKLQRGLTESRRQLGFLEVTDRSKIYATCVPGSGSNEAWRWRIYLPEDRKFNIVLSTGPLPPLSPQLSQKEFLIAMRRSGRGKIGPIDSGEYLHEVALYRSPTNPEQWVAKYGRLGGDGLQLFTTEGVEWINDRNTWGHGRRVSSSEQVEIDPEEGLLLVIVTSSSQISLAREDQTRVALWIELAEGE